MLHRFLQPDNKKKCVGRTGNPAITTHKLTLRYIPSFWLKDNNKYVIGDPNKNSTGEFDFALIESEKIKNTSTNKKTIKDNNIIVCCSPGGNIFMLDNECNILNFNYKQTINAFPLQWMQLIGQTE